MLTSPGLLGASVYVGHHPAVRAGSPVSAMPTKRRRTLMDPDMEAPPRRPALLHHRHQRRLPLRRPPCRWRYLKGGYARGKVAITVI
jgi:hypothetical protein